MLESRQIWLKVWKRLETRRRRRNAVVIGEVELPRPGEGCVHVLEIRGWARGRAGDPATVRRLGERGRLDELGRLSELGVVDRGIT